MKIKIAFILYILIMPTAAISQRLVSFYTSDSIEVFADVYVNNPSQPYIIMAHAPGSSRGEFRAIAEKFLNLNYNCLALDLRNGQKSNYIQNLTVSNNKDFNGKSGYEGITNDLQAALDYVGQKSEKPVILAGSLVAGSVELIMAKNNPKVSAVLAFSPGEYLRPEINVGNQLVAYDKPICVLATTAEKPFVENMLEPVAKSLVTSVYHDASQGYRGAALLWESNSSSEKFWFDLLMFFNQLTKN